MTRGELHARAVAYQAAYDQGLVYTRPYRHLKQADLETFWECVTDLRDTRLYRQFWRDQRDGQVLP